MVMCFGPRTHVRPAVNVSPNETQTAVNSKTITLMITFQNCIWKAAAASAALLTKRGGLLVAQPQAAGNSLHAFAKAHSAMVLASSPRMSAKRSSITLHHGTLLLIMSWGQWLLQLIHTPGRSFRHICPRHEHT